jgi:hypothetical protein
MQTHEQIHLKSLNLTLIRQSSKDMSGGEVLSSKYASIAQKFKSFFFFFFLPPNPPFFNL